MGKIEGIFATNISGKVGNVVFRKAGKQNIVSQRPASVKNPRTDMQQRQRAYIKTVSSAYSVLKPICDHSFEGIAYGADSMNFFKRENYKIVSNAGKAVIKNSSNVVTDSAILVSKGSITWNVSFGNDGIIADFSKYMSDLGITSVADLNINQFLDALGIKNGDQLTVINVSETGKIYGAHDSLQQVSSDINYSRYIINYGNGSEKAFVNKGNSEDTYILNPSILDKESEIDNTAVLIAVTRGVLYIYDYNNDWSPEKYTAIISRRNADKWLRSTATLYADPNFSGFYDIDEVLPSYSPTGERYLNNAER